MEQRQSLCRTWQLSSSWRYCDIKSYQQRLVQKIGSVFAKVVDDVNFRESPHHMDNFQTVNGSARSFKVGAEVVIKTFELALPKKCKEEYGFVVCTTTDEKAGLAQVSIADDVTKRQDLNQNVLDTWESFITKDSKFKDKNKGNFLYGPSAKNIYMITAVIFSNGPCDKSVIKCKNNAGNYTVSAKISPNDKIEIGLQTNSSEVTISQTSMPVHQVVAFRVALITPRSASQPSTPSSVSQRSPAFQLSLFFGRSVSQAPCPNGTQAA